MHPADIKATRKAQRPTAPGAMSRVLDRMDMHNPDAAIERRLARVKRAVADLERLIMLVRAGGRHDA